MVNIQSLRGHQAELVYHLKKEESHIILFQETWLDDSVPDYICPGYRVISRRDRHPGANRGGVLTLQRDDFNGFVHIENSVSEERS